MKKSPAVAGDFLVSLFSIWDWERCFGDGFLVYFVWVRWVGGLTGDFVGVLRENRQRRY